MTVRVFLYVTCLVDQCWPRAGLGAAMLLRHGGCEVVFDEDQTCCGQPACNSGYPGMALGLARRVIEQFELSGADLLVAPSGSCIAQIHHYPGLFADDMQWRARAAALAARSHELSRFLVAHCRLASVPGQYVGKVTWHDSCHGLRDLGLKQEPRQLLALLPGLQLVEMPTAEQCCGFGGTFAVKYPELSVAIAEQKLRHIEASGCDVVAGADVSCLMHLRGRLERLHKPIRTLHLAELLTMGALP